jgi:hypothetical protein
MRVICGYCGNIDKPICKKCNWIDTRYPTEYQGRKFDNKALKLLQEPVQERIGED